MQLIMRTIITFLFILTTFTTLCFSQETVKAPEIDKANNPWIDLIDTAIKIGLGSAVTALGAFALARFNTIRERETEFIKRKRDRIESASKDLERVHSTVIDVAATSGTILDSIDQNREIEERWIVKLHELEHDFNKAFETIHILEGSLSLIDCANAKEEIEKYRGGLTTFSQGVPWIPSLELKGKVQEMNRPLQTMVAARTSFYSHIKTEYKKA